MKPNFSGLSGSNISRADDSGRKLITSFSACTGIAAMLGAVPRWPAMMKILSWFTSFCAASTAFFGS